MLITSQDLVGRPFVARDEESGSIADLLFDDETWTVRYLVVELSSTSVPRSVIVSPRHILERSARDGALRVDLTREQLERSPDIDAAAPVSRIAEKRFHDHFNLPYYWSGPFLWGGSPFPGLVPPPFPAVRPLNFAENTSVSSGPQDIDEETLARLAEVIPDDESRIRSIEEVKGYAVRTEQAEFGSIDDFVLEDESLAIRYLVVDTVRFFPSKSVLVPVALVSDIRWSERRFSFPVGEEEIANAPTYHSISELDRDVEMSVFRHFRMRPYWEGGSTRSASREGGERRT